MDSITMRSEQPRRSLLCVTAVHVMPVLVLIQGCSIGRSPLDPPSRARLKSGDEHRSMLEYAPYRPDVPYATPDLGDPRTAEEFVTLALSRNPSIRVAEAKVNRIRQRAPQARSLDDPMLTIAPVGEMAETAAGQVGLMSSLSQRLPLPSKLDARGRVAELEADQAEAELEQVRLQIAADARRTYWSYFFASSAFQTTSRSRSLLLQFRDVADAQFRAGQRNQQDVWRASAELGNLDNELTLLAQRRDTAAAMLRQLIDAPISWNPGEPIAVEEAGLSMKRDALLARATRTNPGLRRIAERMTQFEQQQRLANLNRWPDLTVSVSYNLVDDDGLSPVANGSDQWWVGFGINLPIWAEKYDAAEREAVFGRLEAASELAAERNRVTFRVEDALLRLESQRAVLRLLRNEVLPDARAAVEASASTYRTGTGDFLTLIDNWRKLLSYEVMEHQVVASVEQSLADLEQAVGSDIGLGTDDVKDDSPPDDATTGESGREANR